MSKNNSVFEQQLDVSRPHTLLTQDVNRAGRLQYRYDDTQELVEVPNVWCNQTYQTRVAAVRWDAKLMDEKANFLEDNPNPDLTRGAVADIVGRYRAKAERIRAEASRIEMSGEQDRPVAAGRMRLDYGPPVTC